MKKTLIIILCVVGLAIPLYAAHIKGGELSYEYLGPGTDPNTSRYALTLKLYIDCAATSPGQLDPSVSLTIFAKGATSTEVANLTAPLSSETMIRFDPNSNPCIGNPPLDVCYRVRSYTTVAILPNTAQGYTVAYQRCCRIIDIRNLQAPSNSYGATYYCEIPGTSVLPDAYTNSSPLYVTQDATAICKGSAFSYSFAAIEPDGDSLVYSLCNGFIGASQAVPNPVAASPPPYTSLTYRNTFSGTSPLGSSVTINSKTGLVTGVAPITLGQYVITACAYEYRRGVLINIHRKDIHIAVSDCIPLKAFLQPEYSFCDNFTVNLKNEQVNPAGSEYTWDFGDGSSFLTTTDLQGKVQHTYSDTGTYRVKMKVILAGQCVDSTTTLAKVYPGFFPGFAFVGSCRFSPFRFFDTTKATYGRVNDWHWDFGDETSNDDHDSNKNPSWLYHSLGLKQVSLIVTSDKGCTGTISKTVEVRDLPLMSLAFRDTLICSIDSLMLSVVGNGVFSWSPGVNIINPSAPNPVVYPKSTTTYRVTLNENGCINTDSVRVRVVDFVTLNAGADTTICLTDSARLRPISDGLRFSWTPQGSIVDPLVREPLVFPPTATTYTVEARIGKCVATDDVVVRPVPYPTANAGFDTVVCYQDTAQLRGSIKGASFNWAPARTLNRSDILTPIAFPLSTTSYRLTVFDTIGCPKPGTDDVVVTVREEIKAFAGNDTAIVVGQPLRLRGRGAELFEWTPPLGLNQRDISDPVALLDNDMAYVMRAYTEEGCFGMDTIKIRVFKTGPDIFVPNAFAPNGVNRILLPIAPGIATLNYFRVFNRWGQLVFQTSEIGRGWDGTLAGKLQDVGTYVWMVSGIDYTGKTVTKKGTATLIR